MSLPDGREFRYARAGVDLAPGKLAQESAVISGHTKDLAVVAAVAVGETAINITLATTGVTANQYAGGFLFVNDVDGEGQLCKIKSHPAQASTSGNVVITVEDEDALRVALTTSSQVGLRFNPYDGVVVAPTTHTGVVVGASICAVTTTYYCWLQTKGPAAMLTNGTVVLGLAVDRSGTTAGAVDVYPLNSGDTAGQEQVIGTVMSVASSTEYSLVNLNIA